MRSLIVEMGRAVGSAAHMTELVRTRHGPFAALGGTDPHEAAEPVTVWVGSGHGSAEGSVSGVTAISETELEEPARLLEAIEQTGAALRLAQPR